jgi:pantoate--beta-alanine ligase
MQTVHSINALRANVADWRAAGLRVGFVPTMGNLHAGHLSLMTQCRGLADKVVSSIFVNPLQFAPGEDYDSYPRTLEADSALLAGIGVDLLFAPAASTIYPRQVDHQAEATTRIHVPSLESELCGVSRPGFFSGVATVVNLLFNLVQPDIAVFGEKDYQQLLVLQRMVADLYMPVEVVGGPIVREPDGLAMSSRNAYLSAAERQQAAALHRVLQHAAAAIHAGNTDYPAIETQASQALQLAGLTADYVSVRRAADLQLPASGDAPLRLLAAAWLGKARLIDNIAI